MMEATREFASYKCDDMIIMARGYAYAKIEYVSIRTYLSKNGIGLRVRYVSYGALCTCICI